MPLTMPARFPNRETITAHQFVQQSNLDHDVPYQPSHIDRVVGELAPSGTALIVT
jgi:hypothetical protein